MNQSYEQGVKPKPRKNLSPDAFSFSPFRLGEMPRTENLYSGAWMRLNIHCSSPNVVLGTLEDASCSSVWWLGVDAFWAPEQAFLPVKKCLALTLLWCKVTSITLPALWSILPLWPYESRTVQMLPLWQEMPFGFVSRVGRVIIEQLPWPFPPPWFPLLCSQPRTSWVQFLVFNSQLLLLGHD